MHDLIILTVLCSIVRRSCVKILSFDVDTLETQNYNKEKNSSNTIKIDALSSSL